MKKLRKKNFKLFLLPMGLILGIIMGELTDNLALGIGVGAILGVILSFLVGNLILSKENTDINNTEDCKTQDDNGKE